MAVRDEGSMTPGPWMMGTSCSFRRILGRDGQGVCVPVPVYTRNGDDSGISLPNGGIDGPDAQVMAMAPMMVSTLEKALDTGRIPQEAVHELQTVLQSIYQKAHLAPMTPGPWHWQDSAKGPQLVNAEGRVVCTSTEQASDGHPDFSFPGGGFKGDDAR